MTKDWIKLLEQLNTANQAQLWNYGQFLLQQQPVIESVLPEPLVLEKPENESVIAATKRLAKSYYMVDRSKMLNETSVLIAKHSLQGVAAAEVIVELEALFLKHYQKWKETAGG
jgi:hypothetical protein